MSRDLADKLVDHLCKYDSLAVLFSAGVDSAIVAKAAELALGSKAIAFTGVGPALAEGELELAKQTAEQIGIEHHVVVTAEINDPLYVVNDKKRCYYCKTELYTTARSEAERLGFQYLANGANADDVSDYRPGMIAADENQVISPLLELGITKQQVRELASHWSLKVWDKPASPCLASRIAYGQAVTPKRLRMVDLAEQWIKKIERKGFPSIREVRVRYLAGNIARVEVQPDWVDFLNQPTQAQNLRNALLGLGFQRIEIAPDGYGSGSMNDLISLETPSSAIVSKAAK